MKIKVYFNDFETSLLDSVGAGYDELVSCIENAMPSIVKAFFKERLKDKKLEVLVSEKKKA